MIKKSVCNKFQSDCINLDLIISFIKSYEDGHHHIKRHIHKEDNAIYKFALRELDDIVINTIDEDCINYEEENTSVKEQNIKILEQLEDKYI